MSLNRREQQLYNYIESNPEEKRFWEYKVRQISLKHLVTADAAQAIEAELWRYFIERAGVVASLRDTVAGEGLRRVSLRNLSEHLIRLWMPPRPVVKKPVV